LELHRYFTDLFPWLFDQYVATGLATNYDGWYFRFRLIDAGPFGFGVGEGFLLGPRFPPND
jgi:hypothetical protein